MSLLPTVGTRSPLSFKRHKRPTSPSRFPGGPRVPDGHSASPSAPGQSPQASSFPLPPNTECVLSTKLYCNRFQTVFFGWCTHCRCSAGTVFLHESKLEHSRPCNPLMRPCPRLLLSFPVAVIRRHAARPVRSFPFNCNRPLHGRPVPCYPSEVLPQPSWRYPCGPPLLRSTVHDSHRSERRSRLPLYLPQDSSPRLASLTPSGLSPLLIPNFLKTCPADDPWPLFITSFFWSFFFFHSKRLARLLNALGPPPVSCLHIFFPYSSPDHGGFSVT